MSSFQITGLAPESFKALFELSDTQLQERHIDRHIADSAPGFPCRVSLTDAAVGEELLLLSFQHLAQASPYQGIGPIFVRRAATQRAQFIDVIPMTLATRLLSVRAYDKTARMIDADVTEGAQLHGLIERLLANHAVDYLHVHYARRGCYAARVDRVPQTN